MKVVILAGGLGTRLSEETSSRPKPMVEIGGRPILWHIMKIYSSQGFNDFVICLGYKGHAIKEYFANYFLHQSDITIDIQKNSVEVHNNVSEPWKVTLVDTGLHTQTGARIKKIQKYLDGQPFMLTYGDGVADIDLAKLIKGHKQSGKLATMTAVQPEGRFGVLNLRDDGTVQKFQEKPQGDGNWANGGFFVFENEFLNYLTLDESLVLEKAPLENLTQQQKLGTYKHPGFWKCMDTLRDCQQLEKLWQSGEAPWNLWEEKKSKGQKRTFPDLNI